MKKNCPKCGSEMVEYDDLGFVKCEKCGYNELAGEDLPSDPRPSKVKGRYSPYKTGGSSRSRK